MKQCGRHFQTFASLITNMLITNREGGWAHHKVRSQIEPLNAVRAIHSAPTARACASRPGHPAGTQLVPTWPKFTSDRNSNF